jgi:hypothetical protein
LLLIAAAAAAAFAVADYVCTLALLPLLNAKASSMLGKCITAVIDNYVQAWFEFLA